MSQVTQKFTDGGSPQVRTYKRGNEEVDLDAFIGLSESGFDDWLDRADIKKKYKKDVQAAYRDLINRINSDPESFVSRLGGGFENNAGITNAAKGFDAYGVAAGYLGKTLRGMQAYKKPEVKSNKTKYNRNSSLFTNDMVFSSADPEGFMMLDQDSYDETTGKRGLKNRIGWLSNRMNEINLDDFYEYENDDDRKHAEDRKSALLKVLGNDNYNDDWFALSSLGLTNLDQYLYTGSTLRTTPLSKEEQQAMTLKNNMTTLDNWMSVNRPYYTGNKRTISLNDPVGTANSSQTAQLQKVFNDMNDDLRKRILVTYIANTAKNPNRMPWDSEPWQVTYNAASFPPGSISRSQFLQMLISTMKKSRIGETNEYYIPDTYSVNEDGSSTVWVYDTVNSTLKEVDTHDIEDYRKLHLADFISANPEFQKESYLYAKKYANLLKQGGILKAQQGVKFDNLLDAITYLAEDLTDDKRIQNKYDKNTKQFTYPNRTSAATDEIAPGNKKYDIEPGGKEVEAKDYYQNWLKILTSDQHQSVAEAWARRYKKLQPTSDVHYKEWFNQDDTFNFDKFKESLLMNDGNNGIGHDFYRGRVYQMLDDKGNVLDGYYNTLQDGYELIDEDPVLDSGNLAYIYKMKKKASPAGTDVDSSDSNSPNIEELKAENERLRAQLNERGEDNSFLAGVSVKPKDSEIKYDKTLDIIEGLGTEALGIGRLAGSIYTNNKVSDVVRESLKPKLHNTYELYSPVTGAFSEMQLRNRQAAETMRQTNQPYTSDASLNASRSLEGQRAANDLQYQGFIADDKEIKRTQAEALKRQEDNIARRSQLANSNRDAIIDNNQAIAQLEANRLKMNWTSVDEYLKEVQSRIIKRATENRQKRQSAYLQASELINKDTRQSALNQVNAKYLAWKSLPGNSNKTTYQYNLETNGEYQRALNDINTNYQWQTLNSAEDIFGKAYKGNYNYTPFDINKYKLRYGGQLRLNSSQLIDKIIRRNNESNS